MLTSTFVIAMVITSWWIPPKLAAVYNWRPRLDVDQLLAASYRTLHHVEGEVPRVGAADTLGR
jgi:hypothetical protein